MVGYPLNTLKQLNVFVRQHCPTFSSLNIRLNGLQTGKVSFTRFQNQTIRASLEATCDTTLPRAGLLLCRVDRFRFRFTGVTSLVSSSV